MRKANVYFHGQLAGLLEETGEGYRFSYDREYLQVGGCAISLTMPVHNTSYESDLLFPFFDGLIPEGWYLDIVSMTLKVDRNDRFGILLATSGHCVGAVSVRAADGDR